MPAVVWDCDGVLVDSEPHSVAAWIDVLGGYGSEATPADVAACTGLGFAPTYAHLAAIPCRQRLPGPASLWPELLEALERSFGPRLEPLPDAAACLRVLADAGVIQGVATTSPRSRLDLTLRVAGLADVFAATAAGDEVARGKPSPDVYLLAASRLGVDPNSCVAVEDTGHGVRAAVAAGMRVIGVVREPAALTALEEGGADVVDRLDPERLLQLLI
jgi:HAD superfamily hydrolase (TIGR01509 family)